QERVFAKGPSPSLGLFRKELCRPLRTRRVMQGPANLPASRSEPSNHGGEKSPPPSHKTRRRYGFNSETTDSFCHCGADHLVFLGWLHSVLAVRRTMKEMFCPHCLGKMRLEFGRWIHTEYRKCRIRFIPRRRRI